MFLNDIFGPEKGVDTPNPVLRINGTRLENYFSPEDGAAPRISELLEQATESIHFLAYSFTNDEFGQILIQKAGRGLQVSGVMEEEQVNSNTGTEYEPLKKSGMDVRLDGNPGLMHHKVFIIDEKVVIIGSYNFSRNAETTNDENTLIIFSPQIARLTMQEFQRVFDQAQLP
jgi:phosphatidylserine/phosphatidylglycerophosphate/cardiolipin synthase-like enzyme